MGHGSRNGNNKRERGMRNKLKEILLRAMQAVVMVPCTSINPQQTRRIRLRCRAMKVNRLATKKLLK